MTIRAPNHINPSEDVQDGRSTDVEEKCATTQKVRPCRWKNLECRETHVNMIPKMGAANAKTHMYMASLPMPLGMVVLAMQFSERLLQ